MLSSVFISPIASAAGSCDAGVGGLSLPTWYQYVPLDSDCNINKDDPVIKDNEGRVVVLILLGVFDIVLNIAGLVSFIFVIVGGFKFLTSTGEPQKIAGARTTILNALLGLAIAIISSVFVGFIAGRLV